MKWSPAFVVRLVHIGSICHQKFNNFHVLINAGLEGREESHTTVSTPSFPLHIRDPLYILLSLLSTQDTHTVSLLSSVPHNINAGTSCAPGEQSHARNSPDFARIMTAGERPSHSCCCINCFEIFYAAKRQCQNALNEKLSQVLETVPYLFSSVVKPRKYGANLEGRKANRKVECRQISIKAF